MTMLDPSPTRLSGLWEDVRRRVPLKTSQRVEEILEKLDARRALPNSPLYGSLLQRYANDKSLLEGKQVHAHLARFGHDRDTFLGNHLVNMYGKCGELEEACSVFEKIRERNVFSYNIMIAVYTQNGDLQKARGVFEDMREKNVVSWNTMIAAYSQHNDLNEAKYLFDRMPDRNVISWNTLITAYAQNGNLRLARKMFERMTSRNIQSWNAIIAAYAQASDSKSALELFRELCCDTRLKPNDITFMSALDACSCPDLLETGRFIHSRMSNTELEDVKVKCALVNMYGKCQSSEDAKRAFDSILGPNLVAWNAMIAAYNLSGLGKQGLYVFRLMDLSGEEPDAISWVSAFNACMLLNSLPVCRAVHANLEHTGFETNLVVRTAILEMYAKCGYVETAREVFDSMERRDIWAWTEIIAGHARNGYGKEALELFRHFGLEGVEPDSVTFLTIISSCSHAGLLHDGVDFFVALTGDYNLPATMEHYLTFIDLLSRVGQLEMAEQLINTMPFQPDEVALMTLLGACKTQGDTERGERISKLATELNPNISSTYVYRRSILSLDHPNTNAK